MKNATFGAVIVSCVAAASLMMATGCKKSEEAEAPPVDTLAAEQQPPAEGAPAEAPPAEAPAQETPLVAPPELTGEVQVPMDQATYDAAQQQRDYEAMAAALIQAQMAGAQNQSQIANPANRMRELQEQIARAMANNDPNAQRAAALLRAQRGAQTGGR